MTEAQLQDAVIQLAHLRGWMTYHTYDSRRSSPGFPDLVLVRADRLVLVELKSASGRVTADQQRWLEALYLTNNEVYLWRPADWLDGTVDRALL